MADDPDTLVAPAPYPPVCYKIIKGADVLDLADAVNLSIAEGWRVEGGVCYVTPGLMDIDKGKPHPYWQAMTRYADWMDRYKD